MGNAPFRTEKNSSKWNLKKVKRHQELKIHKMVQSIVNDCIYYKKAETFKDHSSKAFHRHCWRMLVISQSSHRQVERWKMCINIYSPLVTFHKHQDCPITEDELEKQWNERKRESKLKSLVNPWRRDVDAQVKWQNSGRNCEYAI